MSKNLIFIVVLLIIIVAGAFFAFSTIKVNSSGKTAEVNGDIIQLEIASTSAQQMKGLSGRDALPQDHGMLFVFDKPDTYTFWMKDMRIPIDMIFINDYKVVTIFSNVQPKINGGKDPNPVLYRPNTPANRVLEINAGLAQKYNLKPATLLK